MERIVVGIDGSDGSRRALEWAIDESRLRRCTLLVVHAWQAPFGPTWGTLGEEPSATRRTLNECSRDGGRRRDRRTDRQAPRQWRCSISDR